MELNIAGSSVTVNSVDFEQANAEGVLFTYTVNRSPRTGKCTVIALRNGAVRIPPYMRSLVYSDLTRTSHTFVSVITIDRTITPTMEFDDIDLAVRFIQANC
jgi:hypothetical protein